MQIKSESNQCISKEDSINFHAVATDYLKSSAIGNVDCSNGCKGKLYFCEKQELKLSKGVYDTETTISDATRLAAEKDFEASIFLSQLKEVQGEVKQYNVWSRMNVEALTAEVHSMEVEMIHKAKVLESRLLELPTNVFCLSFSSFQVNTHWPVSWFF